MIFTRSSGPVLSLFILLFISHFIWCKEEPLPQVKQLKAGLFTFGDLEIDKNKSIIRMPAVCNQVNGLVEYGIVHVNGKTHESLFRTNVRPQVLHTSLLLIKGKQVKDFFENLWSENPKQVDYSDFGIKVEISWEVNSTKFNVDLGEMSLNQSNGKTISENSFIFTGSKMIEGTYMGDVSGSILAVYADEEAILNNTDYGSDNDDLWIANGKKMPPLEHEVMISFLLPKS